MDQRGRKELFEALAAAESEHDVLKWKIDDVYLWPFVRHKLCLEYMRVNNIPIPFAKRLTGKLKLVLKGIPELIGFLWLIFVTRKKYEYIFLSKATYRASIEGKWFDRFSDSLIALMGGELSKKSIIVESGVDLAYRKPRYKQSDVAGIQGMLFILGLVSEVITRFVPASYQFDGYEALRASLSEKLGVDLRLKRSALEKQFNRIRLLTMFFEHFVRRKKTRKAFLICYYEESGYALTLACARHGIPSIDIQHGVQGQYHFAYAPYGKIPAQGYNLIPDFFWLWDKYSYDNIANWSSEFHQPFLGGNVWLKHWMKSASVVDQRDDERPGILFSLQPVSNPLPDFILEAIRDSADKYRWQLRLHPRQTLQREEINRSLDRYNIRSKVDIDRATQQPLPAVLKSSAVHLTLFSSVVFEALDLGIPSILTHANGKLMYDADDLGSDFIYYAEDKLTLLRLIEALSAREVAASDVDEAYESRIRAFIF
jgi:hypothetical protein